MTRIKNLCAIAFTLFAAVTASAQTDSEKAVTYPQIFFGLQGGAQTTLTDYNNWELATPTAGFSIGSFFTPVIGARLHLNGLWNKGGFWDGTEDFRYKYKYLTTDIDLLVNLVTLLGKKNYYPMNVYLIGGLGLNCAWDNGEAFARQDKLPMAYENNLLSHNARIGVQFDCNISKHVGISLEFAANNLKDRYNSKMPGKGDWQLAAMFGASYKFAAKKGEKTKKAKVVEEQAEPVEVWETRQDTIWYDDAVVTPKVENGTATWTVFYKIRESDFAADEQLAQIGAFLKDHRECKVDIKSYADAQTGNPKLNLELSKERLQKAVKALTDAGVPESSITSAYYGDTIQPFAENDKNRVTIIVATGLKDIKQKNSVKKFKTKEVRYRVR